MRARLTQTGHEALMARLQALPAAFRQPVLRRMLRVAAAPIQNRMAANAHRRPPAPDMADHIGISSTSRVEGERIGDEAAAVAIGPTQDFFYGRFSEFGTVHESARPWARPAFDGGVSEAFDLMVKQAWVELRRLATKGIGASITSDEDGGQS